MRPDEHVGSSHEAFLTQYVGSPSVEISVVLGEDATQAFSTLPNIALRDALQPVFEAAGKAVGAGVLGNVEAVAAEDAFSGEGVERYALEADGTPQAWVGVRQVGVASQPEAAVLPPGGMKVLYDVEMTLTAEIGRARLPIREVLGLTPGHVLELDRTAGSPADIMINGHLIARGEVVVMDEDYAVRVTEIVDPNGVRNQL
jgi:flagellar motor switch protein FliN/FliY